MVIGKIWMGTRYIEQRKNGRRDYKLRERGRGGMVYYITRAGWGKGTSNKEDR
jgi:hypothetical protein